MRVIERSEFREEGMGITFQNRLRGTLRFGSAWYGQMQAQEAVSDQLGRNLPNDFALIRNALVPKTGLIASMILIGPPGVFVIQPSGAKGVFRAKGAEWLTHAGGRFRPARPNLQQAAFDTAEVLRRYFREVGYEVPQVEPVLAFTNPAAHVDTVHPEARIVLADAIEHFAGSLRERPPIMDGEDVQLLVNVLLHPPEPEPEVEPTARPMRPSRPLPEAPQAIDEAGPFQLEERKVPPRPRRRRARLQRRQVTLLVVMVAVEACVLLAFAALILYPNLLG
jgi:hypothetical protein